MKPVPLSILQLHADLSGDLDRIKERYNCPVDVTLIVRPLGDPEANIAVTTENDIEVAIAKGSNALHLVETKGPTQ